MQRSPYTPGSVAPVVYGREALLRDARRDLAFMKEFPELKGRLEIFVGSRGVGKTSLLRTIENDARSLGFASCWITAGDGPFLGALVEALDTLSREWHDAAREQLASILRNLSVTVAGVKVTSNADEPTAEMSSLGRVVQQALQEAAEGAGSPGLVLLVDEIQAADADGLRALAYAWQHLQSEAPGLPLMTFCAGLTHSQDVITDAVSFAERFRYRQLENLDPESSRAALEEPALARGVHWTPEALDKALALAAGYPYFLQVIGDEAWKAAGYPDAGEVIGGSHVSEANSQFREVQRIFFRSRWMKATPLEQEFMSAMAADGGSPARRGEIAERMGRTTQSISMVRRSLMDKGLIDAPAHGYVEFTAPGFAEFVRREGDPSEEH
ncbi:hypothetical protein CGLAUT_01540 [Corynebacterium glaucum]|uniref:ATP-binding protein n=1 Tax=Corynebacterium glaucum TaxID=187491 RepID=UPI0025B4C9FD|nr:ATP-binding protein [Corynebacterium glaucum]WJZ06818.1 hypothetical protein CGLAUT_01540 [Corynebacterium glaucum]